jgi:hypothetical protein
MMKKVTIIAGAVIAAGIGAYLLRKKLRYRKEKTITNFSTRNGRYLKTAFAKAKSSANEYHWNCR